jgi:hypothetical protein
LPLGAPGVDAGVRSFHLCGEVSTWINGHLRGTAVRKKDRVTLLKKMAGEVDEDWAVDDAPA